MSGAPFLVPPGPARRRAGTYLLAYGLVGTVVLSILLAAALAATVMGRDGFARVDDSIDEVVAVLDTTIAALRSAETTLAGVGVTLSETSATLDTAVTLAGDLSDGAATIATEAGSFAILGQHPFAGIVEPLVQARDGLDQLGTRLDAVGVSLGANAADVTELAGRLGAVADSLSVSRDRLAGIDSSLGGAGLLAMGVLLVLVGWLMVPALAALRVGWRWRSDRASG